MLASHPHRGVSRHHPIDWNSPRHALAKREPRRGKRAVLRALVCTPQGPLVVYNAHLEVFCGLLARIAQLSDIFADARRQADRGYHCQAIMGDMNTMAHGIARLSPNYCCDHMRFRSIGLDEAAVWDRYVLPVTDPRYAATAAEAGGSGISGVGSNATGSSGCSRQAAVDRAEMAAEVAAVEAEAAAVSPEAAAEAAAAEAAAEAAAKAVATGASPAPAPAAGGPGEPPVNRQLLVWGLSPEVARDAVNPGFADPFDPSTATLDNPKYRWLGVSLMKGKLDWVLLRRLQAVGMAVGNDQYQLSDHKWLAAYVALQ